MAVATTNDGRCIRARDSADTLHGWRCGGWGGSGVVDTKKWTNKLPLGSPFTPSHFSEEQELNSSIYAAAFRRPLICHEQLLLSLCDLSKFVANLIGFFRSITAAYIHAFRRGLICHEQLLRSLCDGSAQVCGEFDRFLPQGGRWAAAGTARCHAAARAAGCRVSGGDAVPVHLPVDWLVLNGFLKRERGEHGAGEGGVVSGGWRGGCGCGSSATSMTSPHRWRTSAATTRTSPPCLASPPRASSLSMPRMPSSAPRPPSSPRASPHH
uniref:Uncharacterized protein n=1 Tax=Oryza barthii TaxID=65489 RepID=A0A0D3HM31_9ORYZ